MECDPGGWQPAVNKTMRLDFPEWPELVISLEQIRRLMPVVAILDKRAEPPAHFDRGGGWCGYCGCVYECPGSVVPTPVEPVNLTRGGFMLGTLGSHP